MAKHPVEESPGVSIRMLVRVRIGDTASARGGVVKGRQDNNFEIHKVKN